MTLSEYKQSPAWQGAIELGPRLTRLAEELPAAEEMGLSFQVRQLMVKLPAAIASDLLRGTQLRQFQMLKLVAAVELIERTYPALDTADTRADVDKLAELIMNSPTPVVAEPAGAPAQMPGARPGNPAGAATEAPVTLPAPATLAEPVAAPAGPSTDSGATPPSMSVTPAPAPTAIPVTVESSDAHVQPNSGQ